MSDWAPEGEDLRCIDFVEEVTAYLDGDVDDVQQRRIDRHLEGFEGCRAALEQYRTIIRLAGRLTPADVASIDPLIRDRLLATLRIPRRR